MSIKTIDSDTVLMIHSGLISESNGATVIVDSSDSSHTLTPTNVTHSTAKKLFGTTSLIFDGDGDYITLPASGNWAMGEGDFTMDCWVLVTTAADQVIGIMDQFNEANAIQLYLASSMTMGFYYRDGSSTVTVGNHQTKIVLGDWTHIALVRNANIITPYINGVPSNNTYDATGKNVGSNATAVVGTQKDSTGYSLHGHMEEIRIIKGKALWAEAFTPPSEPNYVVPIDNISKINFTHNYGTFSINDSLNVSLPAGLVQSTSKGSSEVFSISTSYGKPIMSCDEKGVMRWPSEGANSGIGQKVIQLTAGNISDETIEVLKDSLNSFYEIIYTSMDLNGGQSAAGWRYVRWHGFDGSGGNYHFAVVENSGTLESSHTPEWDDDSGKIYLTYGDGNATYRMLIVRSYCALDQVGIL